jgi:serine/threonine-protein kinase
MSRDLATGDRFLKYRIRSVLGRGGMGVVYEATDEYTDDVVALKLLASLRPDFAQRFREECKFYPKLHHPNIVRMRDAGITDAGTAYIIMDRLQGKTVRRMLERMRRLDFLNALHLMLQVADAMQFVHSKGIWHRDLKPENFMVGSEGLERGHLWVLDFGIAKRTGAPSTDTLPEVGTVRYLSPEQARRQKPDGRADIYAFGVIFYEMLTGRHTFLDDTEETTAAEALNGHLRAPLPQAPHEIVPDCPDAVWPLLVRCLEKEPTVRLQSFEELADALRDLVRSSVPPEHVLAKRVRREQQARERRSAYDSLHEIPDDEITIERPGSAAALAATAPAPFVPSGGSGDRMTAPLVGFVPAASVLPFTRARSSPSVGQGSTEPLPPPRPPVRRAVAPAKRPSPPTPTGMAMPPAPEAPPRRSAMLLAPLLGLLLALAGTVVVVVVRTSRAERHAGRSAAPPPSDAAAELPVVALSSQPITALPQEPTAPPAPPEPAPPLKPAAPSATPGTGTKPTAPRPRAAAPPPSPVETAPLVPLFEIPTERASKPKGKR